MPSKRKHQSAIKILIVEDEQLIADTIRYHLERNNLIVTGCAASYREAVELYRSWKPDVVLLDIHLIGAKTVLTLPIFFVGSKNHHPLSTLSPRRENTR